MPTFLVLQLVLGALQEVPSVIRYDFSFGFRSQMYHAEVVSFRLEVTYTDIDRHIYG